MIALRSDVSPPRIPGACAAYFPQFLFVCTPFLHRNHLIVELLIITSDNNLLLLVVTDDDTRVTPREIVKVPKRIYRDEERKEREGQDVDYHPTNVLPLPFDDEDDGFQHDYGNQWEGSSIRDDEVDEVDEVDDGGRKSEGTKQIDQDDKAHRKAAETAQLGEHDDLHQVVDGGVNPATTLREKDAPAIGRGGHTLSVRSEGHLVLREMFHHQGREVTILAEVKQVLLVEGIDVIVLVITNDLVRNNQRRALGGGTDSIHAETAGQTSDTAEQGFKRLRQVMRNVVLVHLNHGRPGIVLVNQFRFTADTNDTTVVKHARNHTVQRIRHDLRIGIHHENVFVEARVHANHVLHLVIDFQFERRHLRVEVHPVQELHADNL
ncbi:hypothetical protein BC938DRAFT_471298 [Jimgerdemannia flammicorona]|uniref:Uncharacterized protein n=1 Tax=Jimgerdemannia flammicorona TaxID=994334 RepID=A0A433Q8D6_9FUNG|nr:hypothetical protein BC938DRAFT_471298 [Jimgerdemannia flammicorona]